jgi:nucleotide-binding universal stress UspA family protein
VKEELPSMENSLRSLGGPDEFDQQVRAQAKKVLDSFESQLTKLGAKVTQEVAAGPAAMMIETIARDGSYAITVLPPGSKEGVERYFLGTVSSKVVRHAPGTVLLLRGEPSAKLARVLIGLDGSEQALRALEQSVDLFKLNEKSANITLVNVVSVHPIFTMVSPVSYMTLVEGNLKMSGEAVLAEGEKRLSDVGIKHAEMKQVEGNPADCMIKMASEVNANLIVVGAQGKGMIEHFLMGSTSTRLADHANCSIAVFKK